jgi:Uri superfamily endonuclease
MNSPAISYALIIRLKTDRKIRIGQLGTFVFSGGYYAYTGSARKNMVKRLARHHWKEGKKLRWHIDYLLNDHAATIIRVEISDLEECALNQSITGEIIVTGFGASDCRNHCRSHLKRLINEL